MLLSKTLVSIPRPESLTPMAVSNKLKYKKVNREDFWPESGKLPSLSALMGPRSWLIPKRLGLTVEDISWLKVPVENWSDYSGYMKLQYFLSNLTVVNDGTEITIRLIQDFVGSCQNEELRQNILLSVEQKRKDVPYRARKKDLKDIGI